MSKKKSFVKINGREAMVIGIIIAMTVLFSILSPTFRTYSTFVSVLDMSYYIALMAIGVTFPLITGGVDLSIGTGLICYSLFGGYLIVHKGMPVWVALLACLVLSIFIGLLNGVLVAFMDLPPFLATLCTCMITRGLGSLLSGGFGVSWPSSLEPAGAFRKIFRININGKVIPIGVILVIVLVLLMNFVLNHTKIGRYTIAIGSNKEATKLAGVSTNAYNCIISKDKLTLDKKRVASETTMTVTADTMENLMGPMKAISAGFEVIGVVLGIFVLYLIINMIVSESATNISVMKVLGFSRKEISNRVINVNHLLVCIGFLIGIPIAYGFVKVGYSDTIENYGILLSPVLTAKTLVIGFVLTWVTYEITLLIQKRKISGIDMVEALKENNRNE